MIINVSDDELQTPNKKIKKHQFPKILKYILLFNCILILTFFIIQLVYIIFINSYSIFNQQSTKQVKHDSIHSVKLDYLKNRKQQELLDSFNLATITNKNPNVIYITNESGLSKVEFELIEE